MRMTKRVRTLFPLLLWALFANVSSLVAASAADAYPQRPIRLIVPFVAGGGADIIARLLSVKMAETLGQQRQWQLRRQGFSGNRRPKVR